MPDYKPSPPLPVTNKRMEIKIEEQVEEKRRSILKVFIEAQLYEPCPEDKEQIYWLNDECMLITYKWIEKDTGITREEAKPIVIEMRNEGLIELTPAVDMEYYAPNGSGYMLTKKGCEWVNKNMPYKPTPPDPLREEAKAVNKKILMREGIPEEHIYQALLTERKREREKIYNIIYKSLPRGKVTAWDWTLWAKDILKLIEPDITNPTKE